MYIFAHLDMALRTERNMLDMNRLQGAKELVKLNIWLNLLLHGCNVKGDTVIDKNCKISDWQKR